MRLFKITLIILMFGCSVFASQDKSPIEQAIISRNTKGLAKIIRQYPSIVNQLCSDGSSLPVHFAVTNGNVEILELLQKSGADINVSNNLGMAPLHIAALNSEYSQEIFFYLLSNPKVDIQCVDLEGNTFLHLMCGKSNFAYSEDRYSYLREPVVLQAIAQVMNIQNDWGQTPLHVSSLNYQFTYMNAKTIKSILSLRPNLALKDAVGNTSLHSLMRGAPFSTLVVDFMNAGADITSTNDEGYNVGETLALYGADAHYKFLKQQESWDNSIGAEYNIESGIDDANAEVLRSMLRMLETGKIYPRGKTGISLLYLSVYWYEQKHDKYSIHDYIVPWILINTAKLDIDKKTWNLLSNFPELKRLVLSPNPTLYSE